MKYLGLFIAFGAGIGTALGAAFGNVGLGVVFGAPLGFLIGLIWAIATKKVNEKDA